MASKETGDPFGGIQRIQVETVGAPGPDRNEEALGRLRNLQTERLEKKAMEGEGALASREVEAIKLEEAELRARREAIEKGQVNPALVGANVAGDPAMKGMGQTLLDIYALGAKNGIDVSPAIAAILTGNPGLAVAAPAKPNEGIPQWMGTFMAKMAERAFDKPADDPKVVILEERVRNMEGTLNNNMNELKSLIQMQGKSTVDPNQMAIENVKAVGMLMSTLQGLVPKVETPRVAAGTGEAEMAIRLQDRQWSHEEKLEELKVKAQEIGVTREIETQKIRKNQEQMAAIPQMIGTVIATTLMEKGAKKEAAPEPRQRTLLDIKKSADKADGPITINCLDCHKPLTFMTNAKMARCLCGSEYDLHLIITESGRPTEVHTTETEPAPENPGGAAAGDDFTRGQ